MDNDRIALIEQLRREAFFAELAAKELEETGTTESWWALTYQIPEKFRGGNENDRAC